MKKFMRIPNLHWLKLPFHGLIKEKSPPRGEPSVVGGRYEIRKRLGYGASGSVFKVWDKRMRRYLAAKVSQTRSEKVIAETQLAGALDHQNIVCIYDVIRHENQFYIIMEYIAGPTLRDFCKPDSLLAPEKALEIILNVCRGLDYAHKQGVIHRDIKPSNIILDRQSCPKITDFGVAQVLELTWRLGLIGTPSYMSPEQLKDENITHRSDIFSLGCVLYELLKGEVAFSGGNFYATVYKVINHDPDPLSNLPRKIRSIAEKVVMKALQKDVNRRYQNCIAFASDLSRALGYINSLQTRS
jgi:serine/threonine-protein kinase